MYRETNILIVPFQNNFLRFLHHIDNIFPLRNPHSGNGYDENKLGYLDTSDTSGRNPLVFHTRKCVLFNKLCIPLSIHPLILLPCQREHVFFGWRMGGGVWEFCHASLSLHFSNKCLTHMIRTLILFPVRDM